MKLKLTLAILAVGFAALAFAVLRTDNAAPPPSEAFRIDRVERGLLRGAVITGESATMNLAERMAHYRVPGVSIAVIDQGEIAWAKGYGVLEAAGTKPVTTETRFQAASISKPVAAMAALALVQQGRLSLDEDVNRTLTSWQVPQNQFTKAERVTLRRLLSHTAGLTVEGFRGYAAGEPVPTLPESLDGQSPANSPPILVDMLPGHSSRYSGGGYNVLQQLLIDATHSQFPGLVDALVLSKIGMTNSTFRQPLPPDWEASAAHGHDAMGQPIKGRWHTHPEMAAAGLWTTPSDLARFAIEMQRSLHGTSNKVLSSDMTRQMLTTQPGGRGLGVALGGAGSVTNFTHGGANVGYRCMLFAYLDTGRGAVVMTNGDGGDGLFNEIMRAISREYGWANYTPTEKTAAKIDPAIYQSYVGQYDESEPPITISTDGRQLYIAAAPFGQERIRLYPSAEDRFFVLEGSLEVSFHKDTQGRVTELEIHAGDERASAKRVK